MHSLTACSKLQYALQVHCLYLLLMHGPICKIELQEQVMLDSTSEGNGIAVSLLAFCEPRHRFILVGSSQ